jgi:hypothetical protein
MIGSINDTVICKAGFYCTTPATKLVCSAGFYCPAATTTMIPCVEGQFCPAGSLVNNVTCPPLPPNVLREAAPYCGIYGLFQDMPAFGIQASQLTVGIAGNSQPSTGVSAVATLSCNICAAALNYGPIANPWAYDLQSRTTFAIQTAAACSTAAGHDPAQIQVSSCDLPFMFFQIYRFSCCPVLIWYRCASSHSLRMRRTFISDNRTACRPLPSARPSTSCPAHASRRELFLIFP